MIPKSDLRAFGRARRSKEDEAFLAALAISPDCADAHALLLLQEEILNAR